MGYSLGIDLGTSNTVAATARQGANNMIEVITEGIFQTTEDGMSFESKDYLPSILYVQDDSTPVVGIYAKAMKGQNTARVISNSKNFIGQDNYKWHIGNKNYTPEIVSSYFLKAIKNALEEKYMSEGQVDSAVITVPASFNMDQRNATKKAAQLAGFKGDITLISEPTAAILDFINEQRKLSDADKYLDLSTPKKIMVFDLGGGTCDVAILIVQVTGSVVYLEEIAVSPHTLLGGNDFDVYAVQGVIEDYERIHQLSLNNCFTEEDLRELKAKLLVQVERAKTFFTMKYTTQKAMFNEVDMEKFEIPIQTFFGENRTSFQYVLSMKKYNDFVESLLNNETAKNIFLPVISTLKEAQMNKEDIDYTFCVGGMTKYPAIWESIKVFMGSDPFRYCDSMQSVARGASVYQYYDIKDLKDHDDVAIDIIPTLPQTVFLNIKNELPYPLIKAKTKAGTPVEYRNFLKVTSTVGITLQLYTGRSPYDPELKSLSNVSISFPRGVQIGSHVSLKLEYTSKGLLEIKAWIEEQPDINIVAVIQGTKLTKEELIEKQEEFNIHNVKGVL